MTFDKIIVRYTNQDGKEYNSRCIDTDPENYHISLHAVMVLAPMMSVNHPLMDGQLHIEFDTPQKTMIKVFRNGQFICETGKVW